MRVKLGIMEFGRLLNIEPIDPNNENEIKECLRYLKSKIETQITLGNAEWINENQINIDIKALKQLIETALITQGVKNWKETAETKIKELLKPGK